MTILSLDFPVPLGLRTEECVLRPLLATDVDRDFEAVMATQEALRERTGGRWPRTGFTRAENLADLQEHEADFAARRGLTYTVLDPTETRCLGCVYLYPLANDDADSADVTDEAMLWFWVRPECVEANLDQRLLVALVRWMREAFANLRVRFRVSATDERQLALLGDAGLQEVDRRVLQRVETVFFA